MKKLLTMILAMVLIVPTILACYPGESCDPWIFEYSVNPCTQLGTINQTSPLEIRINASACPTGNALPDVTCRAGFKSITLDFWQATAGSLFKSVDFDRELLSTCIDSHYTTYCDNVSARVIVYANYTGSNTTVKNDTGWLPFQTGYKGGADDSAFVITTDDTNGFDTEGDYTLVMMVKSTNSSKDAYVVNLNYSVAEAQEVHFGRCKDTNLKPPEFSVDDNRLINSLSGFGRWSASLLYTLLILVVGISMFFAIGLKTRNEDIRIATGLTLFVVVLMIWLGAYLRIINWVALAMFFTGVAIWLAVKIRKIFTG